VETRVLAQQGRKQRGTGAGQTRNKMQFLGQYKTPGFTTSDEQHNHSENFPQGYL
tara:strand:- start:4749 stop:4913 length:165 start_codon:yes stop_codon:yes gene_type:complete